MLFYSSNCNVVVWESDQIHTAILVSRPAPALTCSRDNTKVLYCTVQIGTFCVSAVSVWELGGSPGTRGDPASAIAARSVHNPDRVWSAYLLTIHSRATASKSVLYMNFSKQKWRASTFHKSFKSHLYRISSGYSYRSTRGKSNWVLSKVGTSLRARESAFAYT